MTKFFLKKDRLNFTQGWAIHVQDMIQDEFPDQDILARVVDANQTGQRDEIMDQIMVLIAEEEGGDEEDLE